MKRLVTFTLMPLIGGIMVMFVVFGSSVDEPPRPWLWCLMVPVALAVVLLVASLLNLSIFGPVYWLLGRRNSKNQQNSNDKT